MISEGSPVRGEERGFADEAGRGGGGGEEKGILAILEFLSVPLSKLGCLNPYSAFLIF